MCHNVKNKLVAEAKGIDKTSAPDKLRIGVFHPIKMFK